MQLACGDPPLDNAVDRAKSTFERTKNFKLSCNVISTEKYRSEIKINIDASLYQ